jgi:hypothetical protein
MRYRRAQVVVAISLTYVMLNNVTHLSVVGNYSLAMIKDPSTPRTPLV